MRKVTLVLAILSFPVATLAAPPQATMTPPTKSVSLDDPGDAVLGALGDLEAIEAEAKRFPDAAVGKRIRALVESARGKLGPLAPKSAPKTNIPASSQAALPGGRASTASPGKAMPDKEFHDVLKALKAQNLDGQRLGVVQNAIDAGGYFSSEQIGRIIHWFTGDEMRVEAASRLWGRCTDPAAFDSVINRLDTADGKAKLRQLIGHGGGPADTPGSAPATQPKRPGSTKL